MYPMDDPGLTLDVLAGMNTTVPFRYNLTFGDPTDAMTYQEMALTVLRYVSPVIIVVGTVGNVLLFVVLHRKAMQRHSSSTFLMMLGIIDTIVLFSSCFKTWVRSMTEIDLLHVNNLTCKTTKYVIFTSTHLSSWFAVILTLERLTAVCIPFNVSHTWLSGRPLSVSVIVSAVIASINLHILWASEIELKDGKPTCVEYKQDEAMCDMLRYVNMLVYSVIPSVIIICSNLAIVTYTVKHRDVDFSTTVTQRPALRHRRRNERRLTISLLSITFMWLLLTGPYAMISFFDVNELLRTIAYLLMYTNHAVNFYVYCVTGRKFRWEIKRAFAQQVFCCEKLIHGLKGRMTRGWGNTWEKSGYTKRETADAQCPGNGCPLKCISRRTSIPTNACPKESCVPNDV